MLENKPKLKKNYIIYWFTYSSRPRLWFRILVTLSLLKKGKGAIKKRKARLDLIPTKKFSL
jgi:hypothetical protein